jgi:2-polyprenyl-3-methyl-5-hydroxy-6-metoxy-1,4-benzoquinol methylase
MRIVKLRNQATNLLPYPLKLFLKRKRHKLKRAYNTLRYPFHESSQVQHENIISVSPQDIELALISEVTTENVQVLEKSDGWDLKVYPFKENVFHRSAIDHFMNGVPWQETEVFQRNLNDINAGIERFGCSDIQDLVKRYQQWDKLFISIKERGYIAAKELIGDFKEEITVVIGRNGEIIFNNGRHRLSICKLLNIDLIPVFVLSRHKAWLRFKNELKAFGDSSEVKKIYARIPHPDLHEFEGSQDARRFEVLNENLLPEIREMCGEGKRRPRLLDIGANLGQITIPFHKLGFECWAVEYEPEYSYFLKRLSKGGIRPFHVYEGSIMSFIKSHDHHYDVVLALSVFHHWLKEKHLFEDLKDLLSKIRAQQMFFQPHGYGEKQMQGAYADMSPTDFAEFVRREMEYSCSEEIGVGQDGRPIYSFT